MASSFPPLPSIPEIGLSKDKEEGLSTSFKVFVPKMNGIVFKSCDGMESEMEVVSFAEGGRMGAPRTARGHQRVNRISFSQGSASTGSGSRSVFDWYLDVCDSSKPLQKELLSIQVLNSNDKVVAEWRIKNAWPCRWISPMLGTGSNQLTVEQVSFAHEGIERKQ